jgi:putative ATPase
MSAVLAGVKEIRAAIEQAKYYQQQQQKRSILFVDEVHRFNKAQQDAFLPYIENGTIYFIGATTENPSFALNNALLSRARVYVLNPLTEIELIEIAQQALIDTQRGLGHLSLIMNKELQMQFAQLADGDARRLLNLLELAAELADAKNSQLIDESIAKEILTIDARRFDKRGDEFYHQISALHKSIRGSDPDAALYWFCRMIEAGCDPRYIARRILRMASEDIGNADPRALSLALAASETYERLGSPEGELAIAQAIIFLAIAAKSNAVYSAYNQAMLAVKNSGSLAVPLHLRNAPTALMKQLNYGKDYRYAHQEPQGFSAGETYFPAELIGSRYYYPVERGLEIKIKQHLEYLRQLNSSAD